MGSGRVSMNIRAERRESNDTKWLTDLAASHRAAITDKSAPMSFTIADRSETDDPCVDHQMQMPTATAITPVISISAIHCDWLTSRARSRTPNQKRARGIDLLRADGGTDCLQYSEPRRPPL